MIKYTEKHIRDIDARIELQNKLLSSLKKYKSNDKEEFWLALKDFIKEAKEKCSEKINTTLMSRTDENSIHELKFYSGMKSALDDIVNMVEKSEEYADMATNEIKRLNEERKKIVELVRSR